MGEDKVRVQISDNGIATVTMVRADKHNALDQGMFLVESAGKPVGVATRGDLLRGGLVCEGATRAQFFCAACGAHSHVHLDPHTTAVAYCTSCMERAAPPGLMDDVGGGD